YAGGQLAILFHKSRSRTPGRRLAPVDCKSDKHREPTRDEGCQVALLRLASAMAMTFALALARLQDHFPCSEEQKCFASKRHALSSRQKILDLGMRPSRPRTNPVGDPFPSRGRIRKIR